MNIEYTKNPSYSDIDFITKQINQETSEYGEAYPFAFFIGFAKKIMDKVHELGKLEGCKIATVQTMSFQGA